MAYWQIGLEWDVWDLYAINTYTQPKIAGGGGAVRGTEGHPAAADYLASEKGHLLAKKALFPHGYWGGGGGSCAPPPARYGPDKANP